MESNKVSCWEMGTCARLAQMVERHVYTVNVGSSILSSRTKFNADVAQLVEHFLAKEDVESSNLFIRSIDIYTVDDVF